MWWEFRAARLRNLYRYEKRRNKKPEIKVQYIQFGNQSTSQKKNGVLRTNGRTIRRGKQKLLWFVAVGFILIVLLYGYFNFQ